MKNEVPAYIIKYMECKQPGHEGEKINLICERSGALICSMCAITTHAGQSYKPIKIYLDQLYRRYKLKDSTVRQQLDELQKRKVLLLINLRNCVEKVAAEFMQLEEEILTIYGKLQGQLHQNQARRNKFEEFYLSMIKENYGDPNFQVKNYLYKEDIPTLTDQDVFKEITKSLAGQVEKIRKMFVWEEGKSKEEVEGSVGSKPSGDYEIPKSIIRSNDLFEQTNAAFNSPNMCLFNTELSQWAGKLRVTIQSLQGKVTFGVIRRQDFEKANFVFNEGMNCFFVNSQGKNKGAQTCFIKNIDANTNIDFFVKKSNFRALYKNNNAIFNLPDKKYYFFFAIEGLSKLKVTYPFNK